MSKHTILIVAALVAAMGLLAAGARADNDQTVVIGFGGGGYHMDGDDVHGSRDMLAYHLYAEWYALGELGFGYRRTQTVDVGGVATCEVGICETVTVTTDMLTVNWVPLGSKRYARLGLVGGYGIAQYQFQGTVAILKGPTEKVSTSGTAALAGIYFDWGGTGFGARLGYDALFTQLKDATSASGVRLKTDGSGYMTYLDLRWAF